MKHSIKRFASLSLAVILTMQVFSVAPLQVAAEDPQGKQELYEGLTYEEQSFENTDNANVNAFVITVDTTANPDLVFVAGSPNDERPLKEGLQQTTSDQAKAAALNGRNVLAAVNADFFNINDPDMIQPKGLMIQDGVELTPYYQFTGPDDPEHGVRLFFGVTEDGEAIIGDENTYEERKDELYQAVGGRYLLVDEGEAQTYDGDISFERERAPRTAVGIREDGSVLLVVIDGRNSGGSAGTTLAETASYMEELGAYYALNLDGGGSSTAVIKNPETRNYEVKNVPSDGSERPVGNTLLVVDTSEESTSVDLEQDTDGYYLLTAPEDFREILDGPSENYRLANDVDFSDMENFTIGMFDGTFDGDVYTIENLTAADVGRGYALFDSITSNAEIKDLKLEDVSIENPDTSYTAALVGNCSGTVRNVTVTGSIEGSTDVGSIAATLQSGGRIVGCSVGVAVTGDSHVGGIVGRMYEQTIVDGCYANVRMQGGSQVAAVCGYGSGYVAGSESYIQNCVVTGSITATGIEPGGIGGLAKLGINHCIVTDLDITALNAEAPNAGNATGFLAVWTNGGVPDTQNVILSGNITTDPNNGTVAHRISYHANDKSYNYAGPDALINGEQETGGAHDNQIGADVSKEELQTQSFWEGLDYDFTSTFSWVEEQKMPVLQNADYTVTAPSLEDEMTLEKDEDGYYLIHTAEEFAQIDQLPTGKFRLANDFEMDGAALEPISYFSGELDGQGNTIHGLKVDANGSSYALVETLTSGGLIHDLQLEDVQIRNGAGSYTAALVGNCSGTVRNVTVTGKIYGTDYVGAIAGNVLGTGKLEQCSAGALVSGNGKVGGLAGQVTGTVNACYVNCDVTGVNNVGGVTGYALDNAGGTRLIQNCIVEGSVSCSGIEVGGIAGLAKVTIQNNIVRNMTASSTGKGEPGSGNVAGLLGAWMQNLPAELSITNNVILSGSVSAPSPAEGYRLGKSNKPAQVHDNYANPEILVNGETVVGASNDGNGQDLTDEQMQSKDFFAGLGFNFETVFSWDEETKTISLQNVNQQVEAPAPGPVEGEELQESLALSVGTDETQVNLTWYSDSAEAGTVLWAKQSEVQNGQLPEGASQVTASVRQANKAGFYSNQATISGLEPETVYAYQLVNGGMKSELYTLTTGTADGSFSFALAGDPQIGASGNAAGDADGWDKTLEIVAADQAFEDVDFLLSAGDQVNTASDETQYEGYLDHEALASLPVATVIGNHDTASDAYDEHFNVPNEDESLGTTTAGSDYYFVYDNTLFMVLNSNNMSTAEHKSFMQKAIEETKDQDIQWKVVTFHHSIYSMASHVNDSDIIERRNQLPQVFKELDIDVVLMGHDHVYTRTYMMDGPTPILESDKYTYHDDGDEIPDAVTDSDGILYVTANSASGSKFYDIQSGTAYQWAAVINQEKVPNISRVDVTDNSFTITTYRTSDMSVVDTFTINRTEDTPSQPENALDGVVISQVYGGGGKGDGPISHSFIELYNTTDTDISLENAVLIYSSNRENAEDKHDGSTWTGADTEPAQVTLELTGTIPAHGSYLVRCAAEETAEPILILENADQDWNQVLDNEQYCIQLKSGETVVDAVAVIDNGGEGTALSGISKQKAIRRVVTEGTFADADQNSTDFEVIEYKDQDASFVTHYAPKTAADGAWTPSEYEPAPDEPADLIEAFENGNGSLDLTAIARYDSGMTNADGGVMEIVDYNAETGYAYAVNGQNGTLAVISLAGLEKGETIQQLEGSAVDVKSLVQVDGFTYGDMTSMAISPDGTMLAAAVQAAGYADNGRVVLFTCEADGTLTFQQAVETGVQPDMVTFTPDGSRILTANEGEPREGYNAVDPSGSVTVIDTETLQPQTVDFAAYDTAEARQALVDRGVLVMKNANPSTDFEPEYIAATNETAYVTLQEANAIAVLDLENLTFTGIYSAGFEDYSETPVDIDKKDGQYEPRTYENLMGIRMPDAISLYQADGETYLLTANEGDAREWGDYLNENEIDFGDEGAQSPAGNLTQDTGLTGKVVFFQTADFDGLQDDTDYLFGGRSFTLYRVEDSGLTELFTSADDFEAKTADYLAEYFNCSNDSLEVDDRSGKKGPEPETVVVGEVEDKTYAFITLERIGGVMVYDITNPEDVNYVNYMNSRDFNQEVGADDSPEGLKFIPAEDSPTDEALLLASCEVGGTVAVYELTANGSGSGDGDDDDNQGGGSGGISVRPPVTIPEPFTDVKASDWYYNAVVYVVQNGLMNGVSYSQFNPNGTTTRGMIVTILYRQAGEPTVESAGFTDVAEDAYYADAVAWAAENGIVLGYGDGTFGPNDPITREQLAAMLYRYAGSPAVTQTALSFSDSGQISTYALDAVNWAVQQGVLNGKTGNVLDPQGLATRAQTAQVFQNYLQK